MITNSRFHRAQEQTQRHLAWLTDQKSQAMRLAQMHAELESYTHAYRDWSQPSAFEQRMQEAAALDQEIAKLERTLHSPQVLDLLGDFLPFVERHYAMNAATTVQALPIQARWDAAPSWWTVLLPPPPPAALTGEVPTRDSLDMRDTIQLERYIDTLYFRFLLIGYSKKLNLLVYHQFK